MGMDVLHAHEFCSNNRESLGRSSLAGCFHCLSTFDPKTIDEWIDDGDTAMCPLCHIDSVLASEDVEIDEAFLREMEQYWFGIK